MSLPQKLQNLIQYVSKQSPYYKRLFSLNGIVIKDHVSLEQFDEIPFTTKDDLAKYNEDFLCVDKSKVVDYVTTSGTLSSPVSFYLTENDVNRLAQNEASSLSMTGATSKDVFQLIPLFP